MSISIGKYTEQFRRLTETLTAAFRSGAISLNEFRQALDFPESLEVNEYMPIRPQAMDPVPPTTRIEHTLTFDELDAMRGGDPDLVPILRARGMDIEMGMDMRGRPSVSARSGRFTWADNLARQSRVFIWEGTNPLPVQEQGRFVGSPEVPEPSTAIRRASQHAFEQALDRITAPVEQPHVQATNSSNIPIRTPQRRPSRIEMADMMVSGYPVSSSAYPLTMMTSSIMPLNFNDWGQLGARQVTPVQPEPPKKEKNYDEPDSIGGRKITFDE